MFIIPLFPHFVFRERYVNFVCSLDMMEDIPMKTLFTLWCMHCMSTFEGRDVLQESEFNFILFVCFSFSLDLPILTFYFQFELTRFLSHSSDELAAVVGGGILFLVPRCFPKTQI